MKFIACYVWGLVLAFADAALSAGMLAFVLYIESSNVD